MVNKTHLVSEKKKIALFSVVINLFLSLLKISVGLITGSASLVADGIHSLADFAAALAVFTGIVIANMKSKTFPYGLYKVENLISLVSAFAIFFAGWEIFHEVFLENKVKHIEHLPAAVAVVLITIAVTYLFSNYERKKGEELNSPSLKADAEHVKTDMLSSIVVLVGILGNYFGYPIVEKLAVLVIVALIFHAAWEIMVEALKVLLDATVDSQTLQEVKRIIEEHPLVEKVKSLTRRSSGSYKFLEAEIVLKIDNFERAHELVHQLERKIKSKIPFVEKLIIHFEPPEKREYTYAVLVDSENKLCSEPSECEFLVLLKAKNGKIEKVSTEPIVNQLTMEKGSCAAFIENLADKKVDCLIMGNLFFGKGALYALAFYNINLLIVPKEHLEELIFELKNGRAQCKPVTEFLRG
jgi:cation diffusion facilitator family transporter